MRRDANENPTPEARNGHSPEPPFAPGSYRPTVPSLVLWQIQGVMAAGPQRDFEHGSVYAVTDSYDRRPDPWAALEIARPGASWISIESCNSQTDFPTAWHHSEERGWQIFDAAQCWTWERANPGK